MLWSDKIMQKLSEKLDRRALQQLSSNIANLNTPGFGRSYSPLPGGAGEGAGQASLYRTHPRHLEGRGLQEPRVRTESWTSRRPDGNNVDLDKEMIDLVTNQLRYNAAGAAAKWALCQPARYHQ